MANIENDNTAVIEVTKDDYFIEALEKKRDLIKHTVAKGTTNDEFEMFMYQCARTKLDPLTRQIYCIKTKEKVCIQASIDGLRLIADRTGRYAPGKTEYTYQNDGKLLRSAIATVRKLVKDQWFDVQAEAFFTEYKQGTPIWQQKPHVMLAKCAESLALRKAFPAELSGIYSTEEMGQSDTDIETKLPPQEPRQNPPQALPPPQAEQKQNLPVTEDGLKVALGKNCYAMGVQVAEMRSLGPELVRAGGGLQGAITMTAEWLKEGRRWNPDKGTFILPEEEAEKDELKVELERNCYEMGVPEAEMDKLVSELIELYGGLKEAAEQTTDWLRLGWMWYASDKKLMPPPF